MTQHHVDLLGSLATALAEIPEGVSVTIRMGDWGAGYETEVYLHPADRKCESGEGKTAEAAIRAALAKVRGQRPKIITSHVHPPIPMRGFDWSAYRDGYEPGDKYGTGPTESAAIADLIEQEEE